MDASPWDIGVVDARVIRRIAPNDQMYLGEDASYFREGRSALECIALSVGAAHKDLAQVRRILDLPCGHGRVLRYLRAKFPDAEITACDLDEDGVSFCAEVLGARPAISDRDPAKIPLERGAFDLVWTGSLLTHMDRPLWLPFLGALSSFLAPDGVIVVSTHGRRACELMRSGEYDYGLSAANRERLVELYERDGFGYLDYEGQVDYGVSVSSPPWVVSQLAALPELRIVHMCERSWGDHHDVYACIRDPRLEGSDTTPMRGTAGQMRGGFVKALGDTLSRLGGKSAAGRRKQAWRAERR